VSARAISADTLRGIESVVEASELPGAPLPQAAAIKATLIATVVGHHHPSRVVDAFMLPTGGSEPRVPPETPRANGLDTWRRAFSPAAEGVLHPLLKPTLRYPYRTT
jgi:hypothetical protein